MEKNYVLIAAFLVFFLSTNARCQLVGLSYNSGLGEYQILSINPTTGTSSVLNSNTGTGYSNSIFISNPAIGVAYGDGLDGHLYTYSLSSGAVLASPTFGSSLQALGVGLNGDLVGLSHNSGLSAYQILSINPTTGASSVLNASTGVGYTDNIFISDPAAGVAYAEGVDGHLYTYSLTSGNVLASPTLSSSLQALALGLNGNLVGLSYNSGLGAFQILSINPTNGASSVLNANTGVAYSNNIFISVPSDGVAYAAGVNNHLYTYSLNSGAVVASPSFSPSLQALADSPTPEPNTFSLLILSIILGYAFKIKKVLARSTRT